MCEPSRSLIAVIYCIPAFEVKPQAFEATPVSQHVPHVFMEITDLLYTMFVGDIKS